MTTETQTTLEAAPTELILSRIINAPRALVYRAFTDPQHMAPWLAPAGCTTVCEMDVRPGGAYRTVIHAPDGVQYPIKGVYREVVEPSRLVFTENLSEHPAEWHSQLDEQLRQAGSKLAMEYLVTITLEDHEGKTKLTIGYSFESAADRDAHEQIKWMQGYAEGLERLEAHLAQS